MTRTKQDPVFPPSASSASSAVQLLLSAAPHGQSSSLVFFVSSCLRSHVSPIRRAPLRALRASVVQPLLHVLWVSAANPSSECVRQPQLPKVRRRITQDPR